MTALPPFEGTETDLHQAASTATGGLSDFGEADSYMPGLRQLLRALDNDDSRLTAQGHDFVRNSLIGVLIARLLVEQGLKDNPHCLQRPITRPLVIMGLPRTGTTALHKLLSMDPQFQGVERWLAAFPMPRPERGSWQSNPWYQACQQGLESYFALAPEMRAAHDMRPDDVDECLEILKQNFCSNHYGSTSRVPSYDRWWLQHSEAASYRQLYRVLQLIGANHPHHTWLLKNPGHVANVDLLLKTFPDACVIQTHRSPVKALPSLCSVLRQARGVVEGDAVDAHEIGARELTNWSEALDRADRMRGQSPDQFLDIFQKDLHAAPMDVVRRIYDHFNLTLSPEAEQAMVRRIAQNPEGSHGEHRYRLEEFGLSEALIREKFGAYMQRHHLG